MCSTCGASAAGALRSSARRWLTPKRCCSSTTTTARRSNSTACSISACVPTSSRSSPVASLPSRSVRRAAGVEPVSSAACTSSPGISFCSVAKCCSASVSVGAISAACAPLLDRAQHRVERDDGLARADLAHQQPLHRAVAREVVVDGLHRVALVVGGRERQRVGEPAARQLRRAARAARRARPRGGGRGGAAARSGAASAPRTRAGGGRPRGRRSGRRSSAAARSGSRSIARRRAGSGSSASSAAPRHSRARARICVEESPSVAG